jgi:ferric-dicitrate binding protein FerR (iron transport regulator)
MHKTDLLKKFIDNRCNEEETRLVMQYLEAEPWLLDELISKSEWDETDSSKPINRLIEESMRRAVQAKTNRPVIRMLKPALRYAAIFSALALGLIFLFNSDNNRVQEAPVTAAAIMLPSTKTIHNTRSATQNISLLDGSTVVIYPGSSISFNTDFTSNRSIKLIGKATFHVTKNEGSPFTVYAGDISTTALGTRFLVDNYVDVNTVNVKLYEGRVVVQAVNENLSVRKTYLQAGEQCFVDLSSRLVKVSPLYTPQKASVAAQSTHIPVQSGHRLHFSKTPLPEVLSKLQEVYKQSIRFNAEDINGKYFTGSFSESDSLMTVLKVISAMNELQFNMSGHGIELVKVDDVAQYAEMGATDIATEQPRLVKQNTSTPGAISAPPPSFPQQLQVQLPPQKIILEENETRFTAVPLSELFKELQRQTKRKISFSEAELANINFTGTIPVDQPIRSILTAICRSNGLELTVRKGTFYISKQDQ